MLSVLVYRSMRMTRLQRTLLTVVPALGIASVTLLGARPLCAASAADSAAAQSLFEQARTLLAQGHANEACPKLEESQRLDPGTGTLLNLAQCYELTGRLASAWSKYLEAAASARASDSTNREKMARKRAEVLVPRLSKLMIAVAPGAKAIAGLEITRDGQPVGSAQWDQPIAADEGEHVISASAPGRAPFQTTVVVKGEATTATVNVPELARQEAASAVPTPAPVQPISAPSPLAEQGSGLGMQRTLALVAGGIGVVGLGVGTVFALKSKSKHDEAGKYCDGSECTDPRGVNAGNDAHSAGNVATLGMLVGALGVAGGITLWLTAPHAGSAPKTELSLGPGSLRLRGTW
jgi:tetratricopeptide (TPR) repeat protein